MAASKPAIIICIGAWHRPLHYANLITDLETNGFEVHCPPLGSIDNNNTTFAPDVDQIRSLISRLVSENKDVALLMHSYGGIYGSEAAGPFVKKPGGPGHGVTKLIYMSAWALDAGLSVMDLASSQGVLPFWFSRSDDGQFVLRLPDALAMFYNDLEMEDVVEARKYLGPIGRGAFETKVSFAPWKEVESVYLYCLKDLAVPTQLQDFFLTQEGGRWKSVTIDSGHSPWISKRKETCDAVVKAVVDQL